MKTYAIIGHPVKHSLSPAMHNAAFRDLGMDCAYMAYMVKPGELAESLDSLKNSGVSGFNVTIPHKEAIMEHLDVVSESCSVVGAANTVSVKDGKLHGYNTDMDGCLRPLIGRGIQFGGADALLLGAGGAARAAAVGLTRHNIKSLHICNRDVHRAKNLSAYCAKLGALSTFGPFPADIPAGYDIVINATSVGMGGAPFPSGVSKGDCIAYDMVYSPPETDFVRRFRAAGARIVYGWEMLLSQAELAFEIWHNKKAPRKTMMRALLGDVK